MVGERVVQRCQRTHEVVQVTGDIGSCRLNLPEISSAHAWFPAENKTHAQAWHPIHVMAICWPVGSLYPQGGCQRCQLIGSLICID